jgi:hypothetical protein
MLKIAEMHAGDDATDTRRLDRLRHRYIFQLVKQTEGDLGTCLETEGRETKLVARTGG